MDTTKLVYFIGERWAIHLRRISGAPPPYTDDPILREWSFCNCRREDDRVTRWIAANWRKPHAADPDLWFALGVARFVNWPDTLAEVGYPVPWDRERFVAVLQARAARDDKVFGAAYNISNGGKTTAKAEHVAGVLDALWTRRKSLRPREDDSLLSFCGRLKQMDGLASFMAAQIVADVRYVAPLRNARDWWSFAAPGPGSKRGLNRVLGRPKDAAWSDDGWQAALQKLHEAIMPELQRIGLGDLHAQDLQSCLCELDKFERVRLGEGKPKRRFAPSAARLPANGGEKRGIGTV
jgi:5-hmdU DNA kinase, helical domain